MTVRFLFLIRAGYNYTFLMDSYAKKLCKSHGFTADVRFAYRSMLMVSPGKTIFGTLLLSVVWLTVMLKLVE